MAGIVVPKNSLTINQLLYILDSYTFITDSFFIAIYIVIVFIVRKTWTHMPGAAGGSYSRQAGCMADQQMKIL